MRATGRRTRVAGGSSRITNGRTRVAASGSSRITNGPTRVTDGRAQFADRRCRGDVRVSGAPLRDVFVVAVFEPGQAKKDHRPNCASEQPPVFRRPADDREDAHCDVGKKCQVTEDVMLPLFPQPLSVKAEPRTPSRERPAGGLSVGLARKVGRRTAVRINEIAEIEGHLLQVGRSDPRLKRRPNRNKTRYGRPQAAVSQLLSMAPRSGTKPHEARSGPKRR